MGTILAVAKTKINTLEELLSSKEYNDLWEGWQGKERDKKVMRKVYTTTHKFICAFIVEKDPETNYGRPYNIYILSECKHERFKYPVNYLNEVTIHSILSANEPHHILIDNMEILDLNNENAIETLQERPNGKLTLTKCNRW